MINPFPAVESRATRVVLSLLALGVAAAGTLWLVDLSGAAAGARAAQRHWHPHGYAQILFFLLAVPIGTLVHTPPAAAAGLPVRRAWATTGLLLGYGVLVAAAAWAVAPLAPAQVGGGRRDPSGLYPAWLACVLLSVAVLACAGGLFVRPTRRADPLDFRPPSARRRAAAAGTDRATEPRRRISGALFTTAVFAWVIGAPLLVLLLLRGLADWAVG
ncbi:hypothetical protein GCE86_29500 [Micromonospora terminaliae]|uniref:Uncharacterized protein n=1 Tax=Micromonospora terminaliae TaxID=1914461 RepID=A0AAJ2ZC29_9ACTN|nr:hypothetical protein [Micromonospora terminaliae]NES26634.1 hypothetical protein [Micromonospora terminaliae]QGL50797.1 hypothetical protein GCE86_29500 [Micromonospora terminaliae]